MLPDVTPVPSLVTTDPAKARAFYEGTLGWKVTSDQPHLQFDAGGVKVMVYGRDTPSTADHTAMHWFVSDIKTTVKALAGKGVTFERYPGMEHDELGIAGGGDRPPAAWFKDPDGNIHGVIQVPQS